MEEKLKVLSELLTMVNNGEFKDWTLEYVANAYIELQEEADIQKKADEAIDAVANFLEARIIEEEEPLTD